MSFITAFRKLQELQNYAYEQAHKEISEHKEEIFGKSIPVYKNGKFQLEGRTDFHKLESILKKYKIY